MRAAGFSDLNEDRVLRLIWDEVVAPDNITARLDLDGETFLVEYRRAVNEHIGVCAAVLYAERGHQLQYYYPYYLTYEHSSLEPIVLERHTMTDTYAGVLDDFDTGVSLIFFVTNPVSYRQRPDIEERPQLRGVALAAFADEGIVILPVAQRDGILSAPPDIADALLRSSKAGSDEEAIDIITAEEIEGYRRLSERMETEDLYSVVEQSFMPYGVECDIYSVIAQILVVEENVNLLTGEKLYLMKLSCNDIVFWLCMRQADLTGEPAQGRRIKCKLWMQGHVDTMA